MIYNEEPKIRWSAKDFDALLLWGTKQGMSDLSLSSGNFAWMRVHGTWIKISERTISLDDLIYALESFTNNKSIGAALQSGKKDYDFAYHVEETRGVRHRFRGNASPIAYGYITGVRIIFRVVAPEPAYISKLNLEREILENAFPNNGLVLVTGVMGSGKSTTLSGILREIIEIGGRHVLTYESPIESDLSTIKNPNGPVTQSNIPFHFEDFSSAVRNSTRSAPDVVLIGESRDPETLRGMIESAEIGVAAYSTVHTRSVPETISRILNVFPYAEQRQISATLISSLRLIISQRLLPNPKGGRIALREFLAFTPEIREILLRTAIEDLIEKTEEQLFLHGQTIQKAAEHAFHQGDLLEHDYYAILAERKQS